MTANRVQFEDWDGRGVETPWYHQPALFGQPDPFDQAEWFGCSCKPVWLAVCLGEMRSWIRARRAAA